MDLKKVPEIFKNFYFLFGVSFLIWMLFFDANDLITQIQRSNRVDKLKEEKAFYKKRIKEIKKDRKALLNNKDLLERYAREKYYMKKPEEDLFVVQDKEE